ncbi:MAG: hypothetical protein K2J08_12710 [Ruminococcus sp.]|nr:hypothetical protein [Ruminococcus sp.]
MTINYICKGFDKDFYNFDAVVVPVAEMKSDKSKQEVYGFRLQFLRDFKDDYVEIMQGLPISAFELNGITAVKSAKTGIYYIFVLVRSRCQLPHGKMNRRKREIDLHKKYSSCCEEMIKCINNLDVKNVLVHSSFNQVDFIINRDSDFLAKTLESNIDRFSQKNIYILVEELSKKDINTSMAFYSMKKGTITPEECAKVYVESQVRKSQSYTNKLIRIAEIETKYKKKSAEEQFYEILNNSSCFFDEYINKYSGTDSELAENANISNSTVSKIKSHTYKTKSKNVIIALAIALDLTVDDRKRFINSAGFSYPNTEHDRFIEQQLRRKRYTRVIDFNSDIENEHPYFIIETRASRGYRSKKSDK